MKLATSLVLGFVLAASAYPTCPDLDRGDDDFYYRAFGGWSPASAYEMILSKPCESAHSNARGRYSAHIAPCTFKFHKISSADEKSSPFELSTACSDDNLVGGEESSINTVFEYVAGWKDECVGDFRRCYSIPSNEDIFLNFLCQKKWVVPNGTTHISLDCTEDKNIKQEKIDEYQKKQGDHGESAYYQIEMKKLREMEAILVVVLVIVLLSSISCCALTRRWFVQPYMQNLKIRMMEQRALLHKKHDGDMEDWNP